MLSIPCVIDLGVDEVSLVCVLWILNEKKAKRLRQVSVSYIDVLVIFWIYNIAIAHLTRIRVFYGRWLDVGRRGIVRG